MTATHHVSPGNKAHGHSGGAPLPRPQDPEHDIDAKSTAIWVVGSSIVLFISLYFMLSLFDIVNTTERNRKINNVKTTELNELVGSEKAFLRGETSRSKKSIEQVMQEMAPK